MATHAFSGQWPSEYVGTPSAFGDLDGDGRDDVVFGASGEAPSVGCAYGQMYVMLPSDLPAPTSELVEVSLPKQASYVSVGGDGDCIGFSVSVIGDTDGDGLEDFVTGAPYANYLGDPTVYLVRGGTLPAAPATFDLATDSDARFSGGLGEHLGRAVGPAGDVDGDGLVDILMGEPDPDFRESIGEAFLFTAAQLAPGDYATSDAYLAFESSDNGLGMGALGTAVDIDGDGAREIMLANPYWTVDTADGFRIGAVHLFSAPDVVGAGVVSVEDAGLTIVGSEEEAQLGYEASAVTDRDGDGVDELHCGGDDWGDARFSIWSGSTLRAAWGSGTTLEDAGADLRSDWEIYASFNVGDLDGGGQDDFILGYNSEGLALVYGEVLPASGALDYDDQWFLFDGALVDFQGYGVAGNGDVNADGLVDYLVSIPELADTAGLTWLILGE